MVSNEQLQASGRFERGTTRRTPQSRARLYRSTSARGPATARRTRPSLRRAAPLDVDPDIHAEDGDADDAHDNEDPAQVPAQLPPGEHECRQDEVAGESPR